MKNNLRVLTVFSKILSSKKFLRLTQISLAVDYTLQSDTAQSRYTHSVEVSNTVEIMNSVISRKLGFNVDPRGLGRIVGLLHDIGHTAFGHLGERLLNCLASEYSNGVFTFEGNSNNYVTISKNKLLEGLRNDDKDYVLASLAKHPEELYEEQKYLNKIIEEQILLDSLYLRNNGFVLEKNLEKTIQCQIMDVADENSYIVSDIVDSLNILGKEDLKEIFLKEFVNEEKILKKLMSSISKSKNDFRDLMKDFYLQFIENFSFNKEGVLIPIDEDIERIRLIFAKINREYILKNSSIIIKREKNKILMEKVFRFHFENHGVNMPSRFYKKQFDDSKDDLSKLKIIRNMCGSFTDKGIKAEYKRLFPNKKEK